jgi:hypothetical protein
VHPELEYATFRPITTHQLLPTHFRQILSEASAKYVITHSNFGTNADHLHIAFDPTSGMSVSTLRPQNTKNACAVGVNAFKRFLDAENVSLDYVFDCMSNDPNGKCLGAVMGKIALHVAVNAGVKEKMLTTNTVMSYFRHVKNWLLELYPGCRAAIE